MVAHTTLLEISRTGSIVNFFYIAVTLVGNVHIMNAVQHCTFHAGYNFISIMDLYCIVISRANT